MRRISVTVLISLLAAAIAAHAATVTYQSATSTVQSNNVLQVDQSQAALEGRADSQGIWPGSPTNAQARTAARSRAAEIGANAMILDTAFTRLPFDEVISAATYNVSISAEFVNRNASIEFYLPPSYLEVLSNGELPTNEMEVLIYATLAVCYTTSCLSADQRFLFQAIASASANNQTHSVIAHGDPTLDLTPLQNPTVTFTPGFLSTYLIEFPEFFGTLEIGNIPAGSPLRVEYQIQARAKGLAVYNHAIAAINDPFTVTTDPIRQGTPISVTFTDSAVDPVPEPSSALLLLAGVVTFAFRRMNHFR